MGIEAILKTFKQNKIDPISATENDVPDSPGNYIICLKKQSNLPVISGTTRPILKKFQGLNVIYVGLASKSLSKRDFRQHFRGNNAGSSTLRKSIGSLMSLTKIPRDKKVDSKKTKFSIQDEKKLTKWMNENLVLFVCPNADYINVEIKLINEFNPPLNLKDNRNEINSNFRKLVSSLRNASKERDNAKSHKALKSKIADRNSVKPLFVDNNSVAINHNATFFDFILAVGGLSVFGLLILIIILIVALFIYSFIM